MRKHVGSETAFFFLYRWLIWPLLRGTFEILARFVPKIERGLELRQSVDGRAPWIKLLPPSPPTVWFHCASGEFEYAKPVITLLKQEAPQMKVVVTYFSPSYADNIRKFAGVDWVVPLPWDTPSALSTFLNSYRPRFFLIARTDVWPEAARQARLRNLRSALFSAALTPRSRRTRGLGRWATRATMNQLDAVFCVSADDVATFADLKLERPLVQAQGDTRYDQVIARLADPKPLRDDLFAALSDRDLLVCGSTWPEDEAVLVPALKQLMTSTATTKGVTGCLVPHEPTPAHLAELETLLLNHGLQGVRYSDAQAAEKLRQLPNACLIVDQTGILAEAYLRGRWAFVGGSFRKNVHSVMEPLAAGCLTLVGPFHSNNREALAFQQLGVSGSALGFVTVVKSSEEIVRDLRSLQSAGSAVELKEEIRRAVLSRTGSSKALVKWILTDL